MTIDQGFKLHPGAAFDITEIWEFIAKEIRSPHAGSARRFSTSSVSLSPSLTRVTGGMT